MISALFGVKWHDLFFPSTSFLELFIRGTVVYLALFIILRFLPNRQVGAVGIADLLVVVLFANAAQNAMSSDYRSITDGLLLVLVIIFWSYALNWLGYKSPNFQRLITPPPLLLVKNGRMIYHNLRREMITQSELNSQLRKQGVKSLTNVKAAFMEADGSISVITNEKGER